MKAYQNGTEFHDEAGRLLMACPGLAEMQARAAFLAAFPGHTLENEDVAVLMARAGYSARHTGGNCMVWATDRRDGCEQWISCHNALTGPPRESVWSVGTYDMDGGSNDAPYEVPLAVAIRAARSIPAPVGQQLQMSETEFSDLLEFPVGTRVRLVREWEAYPVGIIPAGLLGTVVETMREGECRGEVRLERHISDLDEWGNVIQVMLNPTDYPNCWADWESLWPNIAGEFPDYPLESLPAVPSDWTDESWGNDTCPSWTTPTGIHVFVDYPDESMREMPGGSRYTVMEYGAGEPIAHTDNWAEVLYIALYDTPTAHPAPWHGTTETPESLAAAFSAVLRAWLTGAEWVEMQKENRTREGDSCASHDYCDSNMAMAEACEMLGIHVWREEGERGDSMYEEATNFISAAWGIAKRDYLS